MPEKMVFGAVRILKSEFEAFNLFKDPEVKTVFDFDLSKPEAADYEKTLLKIVNTLSKSAKARSMNDPSMQIHQHFQRISDSNSFQLGEYSYEKHADGNFHFNFFKAMGGGLCAFASLFNHSCYPNVAHVIVDNKLVFIVARPIKAGEQLFVTYGPRYSTDVISMRQARLSLYGFNCDCVACANKYPRLLELPREDRNFIHPKLLTATQNAIAQFRKNCAYINEHSMLPPSYEAAYLFDHNHILLCCITRRTLNNSEFEEADFTPKINYPK